MPFLVGRHDASCLCGWVFWGDKKCGVHHARCTSAKCRDSSIQLAIKCACGQRRKVATGCCDTFVRASHTGGHESRIDGKFRSKLSVGHRDILGNGRDFVLRNEAWCVISPRSRVPGGWRARVVLVEAIRAGGRGSKVGAYKDGECAPGSCIANASAVQGGAGKNAADNDLVTALVCADSVDILLGCEAPSKGVRRSIALSLAKVQGELLHVQLSRLLIFWHFSVYHQRFDNGFKQASCWCARANCACVVHATT